MAQLALGLGGSALGGGLLGGAGQALGFFAGSILGGVLFGFGPPDTVQEGPRLTDSKVQTSAYGQYISVVYGIMRVSGNLIWASDVREVVIETSQEVGKGGGGGVVSRNYEYYRSFAVGICEGPVNGIKKVFANTELIFDNVNNAPGTQILGEGEAYYLYSVSAGMGHYTLSNDVGGRYLSATFNGTRGGDYFYQGKIKPDDTRFSFAIGPDVPPPAKVYYLPVEDIYGEYALIRGALQSEKYGLTNVGLGNRPDYYDDPLYEVRPTSPVPLPHPQVFEDTYVPGSINAFDFVFLSSKDTSPAYDITLYNGTELQTPSSVIQSFEGVANTPAYKGLCYAVFDDFRITDFGNQIPNFTFEVDA